MVPDSKYGPSPRVRGERRWVRLQHAWKTGHPRACGENANVPVGTKRVTGPSPRVRGERHRTTRCAMPTAGHPRACGENPRGTSRCAASPPGHPRACGENSPTDFRGAAPRSGHPRACGENTWQTLGFQRFEGPEVFSDSSSMAGPGRGVKRSMAWRQAASLMAIIGRPSRSTSWLSMRPWTRSA